MIVVHLNPSGVERVSFESRSDLEEDLCMAVWPLVRKRLGKLSLELKEACGLRTEEDKKREDNSTENGC
jgi:hypothetical protein